MYIQRKARTQSTELLNKDKRKYFIIKTAPVIVLIFFFIIVFNLYIFHDDSMNSHVGIGTKFDNDINRGDVISFDKDGEIQVRRIIGLPGDSIKINYDTIYINDQKCEEKYYQGKTYAEEIDFTVPEGCLFVLADNRDDYEDSRDYGYINIENVIEKIIFIG